MTYYPRKLNLSIFDDKDKLLFTCDEKTKLNFNTSESVSGAVGECNLSIVGLRPEKITFLSNYKSLMFGDFKKIKVLLSAGYTNQYNAIFSGQICEAISDFNTPEYTINLKVANGYYNNNEYYKEDYPSQVKLTKILNDLAEKVVCNIYKAPSFEDYDFENFSYNEPFYTILRKLSQITNKDIYYSNNTIYAKERGSKIDNKKVVIYGFKNLIGTPTPTPIGCDFDVRLNPNIYTGKVVQVESRRMNFLNRVKYVVQSISHSGDTYGSDWKTHIKTIIEGNLYEKS
jgi:hypothetical protein